MKTYIYKAFLPVGFFFAFCIAGCQSDDHIHPQEVQLHVLLEGEVPETRVNVAGTAFLADDKFRFFFNSDRPTGLYSDSPSTSGSDADLKITDYNYVSANNWATTHPIYWDDHEIIADRNFCGIMPFDENYNTSDHTFAIRTDQTIVESNISHYQKSDLLLARTETNARLIPLKFWHILSRVIVNITASADTGVDGYFILTELEGMQVELIDIEPVAKIAYTIPIVPGEDYDPNVTVTAQGTKSLINMHCSKTPAEKDKKITATYVSVVPPQVITSGNRALRITMNVEGTKKQYYFKHDSNIDFVQSKQTIINIDLYKNKVKLSDVADEVDIQPWGTIKAKDNDPIKLPKQP